MEFRNPVLKPLRIDEKPDDFRKARFVVIEPYKSV